jgi:Rrf2 family protein
MSMLSQRARYALRAMLMLAEFDNTRPVQIAEIAVRESVPRKFLEAILLDLKRHGLVSSVRGRHGGYALALPKDAITFAQIIRIVDGPIAQVPCASQTAYRRCADCRDEASCAIRRVLKRVRDASAAILDSATLVNPTAAVPTRFASSHARTDARRD